MADTNNILVCLDYAFGSSLSLAGHQGAALCFYINYRAKEWPVSLHPQ